MSQTSANSSPYATRALPRTLHQVLPSGSTVLERALVNAYDAQPIPTVIEQLNDLDRIDARLLNAIAYKLNVDAWSSAWSDAVKRAYLKNAVKIQAKKGTVWAVKETLKALGQGDAVIIERVGSRFWDSGDRWDAGYIWGEQQHWATFALRLTQRVTQAQGQVIINAISAVKPARCHLVYIDWANDDLRWDSGVRWDSGNTWDLVLA